MHFEGEFRVPGRPEDVIHRFADVERMASCFPGAVLDNQEEDGTWNGGLLVTFGPKKIKFKGKVRVDTDLEGCSGKIAGRGAADMRAARVSVTCTYKLLPDEAAGTPTTVCRIVSDAELTGVLAEFARSGGQIFAAALMEEFARRAQAEFSKAEPAPEPEPASAPAAEPAPVMAETAQADAAPTPTPAAPPPQAAARPAPPPPPPSRPEPMAISAQGLLWAVIKAKFLGFLAKLGLRRAA